ncbi:MAG TPA: amidohydrolase family protein [Candidatus Sulfotelmatobacter sp.]|nr:amidohydrolase family protein [Candidatus Sulfotelmatobacter sp.]
MKAPVFLSITIISLLVSSAQAQKEIADIIIVNANIFTANDAQPHAEAIAIKGDRILALGTSQEITSRAGPKTTKIDAAGRLVIPGILDTHIHYMLMGIVPDVTNVDFGGFAPTCRHVLETVADKVKDVLQGNLLFGFMGADAFFDPECTPAALDRIAPKTPVFLAGGSVHAGMLNSAAEKWFGVDTSAPPPLAGWYGKDAKSKTWDGVVHNSAMLPLFTRVLSDGTHEDEKLQKYFLDEARWGITGNTFMEYNPAARVEQLARVNAPFRVWVMPFAQYETGQKRRRLQQVTVPPGIADRVTSHGEKWVLDGEPVHRTAPMRAPYADDPTTSGQTDYPDAEVRAILSEAVQHDLPLMIHVTADRSAQQLFDQMGATGGEKVWANRRVRIEHGDGVIGDLIPRARKLGVTVAKNPMYFVGDVNLRRLGPQRAAVWNPCRSLLEAGIPMVLASDGAPGFPFSNPFLNIQIATLYPANPKEAITREQALIAFTRTAAYSEFVEDRLGTLEAGKVADLAVLAQDLFKVSNDDLPKTESVLTIVGGKIAYSREPIR